MQVQFGGDVATVRPERPWPRAWWTAYEEGEVYALLGPNGAGKSPTVEILEGHRERTSGSVNVLGMDPVDGGREFRDRIGIVLQESEPVPELTALEAVTMQSAYYSNARNPNEVLEIVGLTDSADQRTRKLSGGQKRRLDLALALIGNPSLVFLDEPTTGFDPSARRESWDMIERLRELGSTVLLTTHYMDEAEQLSDRIVVIADGTIVARGTADELARQVNAVTQITWRPRPDDPKPPDRMGWTDDGHGRAVIATNDVVVSLHALTTWATEMSVDLPELNVARPTLEDVYLQLTASPEVSA